MLSILFVLAIDPTFQVPNSVEQGDTLRVTGNPAGETYAAFADKKLRLFAHPTGLAGLVPVPATLAPGQYPLKITSADGKVLFTQTIEVRDARFPIQNIATTSAMTSLKPAPGEVESIQTFLNHTGEERLWTEPLRAPTPECMNSPYGVQRYYHGKPSGNFHRGLDLRSPSGTPVKATAAGVVKIAHMWNYTGGTVGVDHGQGFTSMYLHLSKIAATEGATVQAGDIVGYVGSTGFATGPHLHWGLFVGGVAVNPRKWITVNACAESPARKPVARKKTAQKRVSGSKG
ncbi:MAG: M23 family metallopeptidase [Bryobacteraceae bacterium]|nr:M23 family metallopeptidase [Bryobacteraceae bacterium]